MRIQSNDVVILDTTDTKKIDLHITSNHPTVQIYDKNNSQEPLTPDWEKNPLVLTPVLYIDSEPIVDDSDLTFTWTRIRGSEINEESAGDSKILTIPTNDDLDAYSAVRYKCQVKSKSGKSFFNEITFARIDNGVTAPTVQARYSIDGNKANMEVALDPSIHKYIHFSYDGGLNWTEGVKIAGEQGKDGQSISLKGTAYTNDELVVNGVVVLYSDETKQTQIVGKTSGDSYLVEGYLCVYNGSQFVCTGQLQGPKGEDGVTYYLYIRYADSTSGSNFSDVPGSRKYVGFYRSTVTPLPTNIDKSSATWNWAKFAGDDAKGITLIGNAQVFKINKNNDVDPGKITITAQAENTSVTSWSYNTDGSTTFTNFTSSNPPVGVSLSNNVVAITGSAMTSNLMTIKASDGVHSDIFTVYKVSDGADGSPGGKGDSAPIAFLTNENISFAANAQGQVTGTTVYCNVVAYTGTTQVTPTIGTILSTELPSGMSINPNDITTVSNQVRIPIVIANNATLGSAQNVNGVINIPVTSPIATTLQLTWSKINSGANGTSASLVNVTPSALYFKSTKGKDGEFTPEFIYLYPRFQNVAYSNWQYSIDGGVNWVAASGANGLTIGTYSSVPNTLRVSRASTLYTDSITSISFRCNSTTSGVYDTVSIAKLFDVDVEEINTRITNSLAEVKTTTDSIASRVSATESSMATINNNVSSITTRVSEAEQKITSTAIVSTVRQSTDYTNDLGKKVNSSEIISKINQTAESVTINANKIGLLGATNIPDLTADKIKGGTLTLGGSSATTQNGQLLVKNASNVDMLKVNKDGIVAKSGHLAVAEDFQNSRFDWETETWYTTTNTRQLDLASDYLRMGIYTSSGYSPYMVLSDMSLRFQGNAQGIGSWGSFIGHDDGDFVIQDTVRSNISFRGYGGTEMANISTDSFNISVPTVFDGGILYVPIAANTNLNNLKTPGFYKCGLNATAITLVNCPTASAFSLVIEAHAGVKQTLTVYLTANKPIIYVRNFYGNTWGEWSRLCYAGESSTLWSGAIKNGQTITVNESIRNFKFLSCVIGEATFDLGIVLGTFLDSSVSQLHFGAIFTETSGLAGSDLMGAKFTINSDTSLTLIGCASKVASTLHCRKIVGWR